MVVRTENVIQSTLPRGDHSLSGVYFQNRNTSNMNQNTAAAALFDDLRYGEEDVSERFL